MKKKHFPRHPIIRDLEKHAFDYLLFVTAGTLFLVTLNLFSGERLYEFLILLGFTSFYIIWGLYHHTITDTIRLKNMLEYILIGFTILFLVKLLIFL